MADFIFDNTSGELSKGNNAEPNTWTSQTFAGGIINANIARFKIRIRTASRCTFTISLLANNNTVPVASETFSVTGTTTARWYEITLPEPFRVITYPMEIRVSHVSAVRNAYYVMYKTSPAPLAGTQLYNRSSNVGGTNDVVTNATALSAIYDAIVVEPEPEPVYTPKKWSGSAWVDSSVKRWDGTTWAPAAVNRIVPPPARYYDASSLITNINNGSLTGITDFQTTYGYDVYNINAPTTILSPYTSEAVDPSSAEYKRTLALIVDQTTKYPASLVQLISLERITLSKNITNPSRPQSDYSGLTSSDRMWMDVDGLIEDTLASKTSVEQTFHHEMFHLIQVTWPTEMQAMENEWVPKNTMPYQGNDYQTLYPGRPEGFTRWYATVNFKEDSADIFGYIMSTGRTGALEQMIQEDPIVAWKVARMKQLMSTLSNEFANRFYYQAIHSI